MWYFRDKILHKHSTALVFVLNTKVITKINYYINNDVQIHGGRFFCFKTGFCNFSQVVVNNVVYFLLVNREFIGFSERRSTYNCSSCNNLPYTFSDRRSERRLSKHVLNLNLTANKT